MAIYAVCSVRYTSICVNLYGVCDDIILVMITGVIEWI